jgi:hypothetical protein
MGENDLEGRLEMYVMFRRLLQLICYDFDPIDFILAACDVEGNFLVVKVGDSCAFTLHSLRSCLTGLPIHRSVIMHASQLVSLPYS